MAWPLVVEKLRILRPICHALPNRDARRQYSRHYAVPHNTAQPVYCDILWPYHTMMLSFKLYVSCIILVLSACCAVAASRLLLHVVSRRVFDTVIITRWRKPWKKECVLIHGLGTSVLLVHAFPHKCGKSYIGVLLSICLKTPNRPLAFFVSKMCWSERYPYYK